MAQDQRLMKESGAVTSGVRDESPNDTWLNGSARLLQLRETTNTQHYLKVGIRKLF